MKCVRSDALPPDVAARSLCRACGAAATHLCDWRIGAGRTCDALMCEAHARQVGPNKHLCPTHNAEWENRKAAKAAHEVCRTP